MDPNALLQEIRDIRAFIFAEGMSESEEFQQNAWNLADKIDNLDVWITKGGFLPEEWAENSGN